MQEWLIALIIFICLVTASLGSLAVYPRLPARYRDDDTSSVIRLIANIFVVMTSLVLGLMINSAKNTLESVDRNVHTFSTGLIVLDRTLRQYGPDARETRQHLLAYAERPAHRMQPDDPIIADRVSENLLMEAGKSLRALKPQDPDKFAMWQSAEEQYQKLVELRWIIVGQSEGTIPAPLVAMVVAWLVLIFASFGYRAPRNAVVVTSFLLSSLLLAAAIYLILDMDAPFAGPVKVSPAPLLRAIAEMQK